MEIPGFREKLQVEKTISKVRYYAINTAKLRENPISTKVGKLKANYRMALALKCV